MRRLTKLLSICIPVGIAAFLLWAFVFSLKPSLERHIIPAYPTRYASLREILDYYKEELAEQGKLVEIRVLNEADYDEKRDVTGIAGNGYLYLFAVSDVFSTRFKCGPVRVITIYGVGSGEE